MSKTQVLITVPNGSGWAHKCVFFALVEMLKDPRYHTEVQMPTHRPYVHNLHKCQQEMLRKGFDYWITLDADNPPSKNPLDLIELDLDIVGCPTPVFANLKRGDYPCYYNAMDEVKGGWKPHSPCEGLAEVDAVGSGCMVIARRVMEDLKAPFMREWDENGLVTAGCDYSFCRRARNAGYRVWAHFDYPCRHFNEVELIETQQAFIEFFEKESING